MKKQFIEALKPHCNGVDLPLSLDIKKVVDIIFANINLCTNCAYDIPVCTGNPCFGDGLGNDNVICCNEYKTK